MRVLRVLVDTNVLLRAIQRNSPRSVAARGALRQLIAEGSTLCLTPQNIREFWNVCTRPADKNGLGLSIVWTERRTRFLERFFVVLPDSQNTYLIWRKLAVEHAVIGTKVHDAWLAAAAGAHGIRRILTFNGGDFARFSSIEVLDPLDTQPKRELPTEDREHPWSVGRILDHIRSRQLESTLDDEITQAFHDIWNQYAESTEKPETLYHFCSETNMRSILFHTRHLRAGPIAKTNDPEETVDAFASLIGTDRKEKIREALLRINQYLACFSPDAELPGQWDEYGDKCSGCAIGFDRSRLEEWCWSQDPPATLYPMMYDASLHLEMRQKYQERVYDICRRLLPAAAWRSPAMTEFLQTGSATESLFMFGLNKKDERSSAEREWRIRFVVRKENAGDQFVKLEICEPGMVKEIVLGSRCKADSDLLQGELHNAGLSSVSVRRSACQCPELPAAAS
jgi:predicted nucleic acid-binding protein